VDPGAGTGATWNQSIYNNTLYAGTSPCISVSPTIIPPASLTVQNNHCISDQPSSQAWCWNNAGGSFNCGAVSSLVFTNNILMPTAQAASEGYAVSNSFQPSTGSVDTVGAGLNLSASCASIGTSLCSDLLKVARPASLSPWDVGAYQYQTAGGVSPLITVQPEFQAITASQTATFSVIAAGTAPLNYQWMQNGAAIPGATLPSYTAPANSADGTLYSVTVTNAFGSVTSGPALLSVSPTPGQLTPSSSALTFGTVYIGTQSAQSVTLTNSSNSYITIANLSISGAGFTVSGESSGLILGPGETATLNVIFAPSSVGSVSGSLTINSDATTSSTVIALSAAGAVPVHSVSVTWNADTSSVFGYNVYRATNVSGPYTKINLTPVTTTQYGDLNVLAGQTYFYCVTALDANTIESIFSTPAPVTVPTP